MSRPRSLPHQVALMLLYGEFDFIERHQDLVIGNVACICRQLKTTPRYLRESLEWLEEQFDNTRKYVIIEVKWHSTYFTCKVGPPIGMAIDMGDVIDEQADGNS